MKKAIKIEYCGAPWNEFFFFNLKSLWKLQLNYLYKEQNFLKHR